VALSSQDYLGGKYRLLNLLRVGKTCQLWEAINDNEGKRYAIKVLLAEYVKDKTEVAFLKHEYEVGSKLDHPRVVRHYYFGRGQSVYLVMEMFQAPNIKMVVQQGGIEEITPHIHKVVSQAAEGLAYFHKQGWIHRDIKPDNYLMKPNGETKLIDFALAVRKPSGLAKLFPKRSSLVQGTRSYMSPEQIRGQHLDERADIYSFGCMLFEMVAGKPPFTGSSTQELLNKHLSSPPPPVQAYNRSVTEQCGNLIKRMLNKKPDDRPRTMDDFLTVFHSIQVFERESRRPAT
jgi:serine/threonine-protein kinase